MPSLGGSATTSQVPDPEVDEKNSSFLPMKDGSYKSRDHAHARKEQTNISTLNHVPILEDRGSFGRLEQKARDLVYHIDLVLSALVIRYFPSQHPILFIRTNSSCEHCPIWIQQDTEYTNNHQRHLVRQ